MRKAVLLGLVVMLGVLTISAVAFAGRGKNGNGKNFSARLNGWEEVPSQVTTGSGRFRARAINTTRIEFELSYRNLEGANVVGAHIHIGSRHENGGIVAGLCSVPTQPACPAGPTATVTGTIEANDIVAQSPDQGVEAGNFADLLRAMRKGETYANVHTAPRAPGGEIRGQVRKGGNDDDDDD